MKLRIETRTVHYRKWGVPETKIRASIYVDDTFVGHLMALPDTIKPLIETIKKGATELGYRYEVHANQG